MSLLVLVCLYLTPDPNRLGADDWREREKWSARYDNVISAVLMPAKVSESPEVNTRVAAILGRNMRYFKPDYPERLLRDRNYPEWLRLCVLERDSGVWPMAEVFYEIHMDGEKATAFFELAPANNQGWLRRHIVPGELEQFHAHIAEYRKARK